jgi:hypothetical protein
MGKWTEEVPELLITIWEEHYKLSKVNMDKVLEFIKESLAKNLSGVNKTVKIVISKMDCLSKYLTFNYKTNVECPAI